MKLNKKIIFKKNISKKEIEDLCKIKVEHWNYDLKSQINWWKENSDEDYLIITLMSGKKKVAFLRIRRREIFIYNKPLKCSFITEVCVSNKFKSMGVGRKIMFEANKYLISQKEVGYLLCFKDKDEFYKKCKWILFKDVNIRSKSFESFLRNNQKSCFFFNIKQKITLAQLNNITIEVR